MNRFMMSFTVLMLATACQNSSAPGEEEKAAKSEVQEKANQPGKAKKAKAVDDLPTEEDFAEAVAKEINEESDLDEELDSLEKDISG